MKFKTLLKQMGACEHAIVWVGEKSMHEAWDTCERGDWMLWFYTRYRPGDLQGVTLVKGLIANTVRHLMSDQRSLDAVDSAIEFGGGKVGTEQLWASKHGAAMCAIGYAARAAYYACNTACYDNIADFVTAAVYESYDDFLSGLQAKKDSLKNSADICRKYLNLGELNETDQA